MAAASSAGFAVAGVFDSEQETRTARTTARSAGGHRMVIWDASTIPGVALAAAL